MAVRFRELGCGSFSKTARKLPPGVSFHALLSSAAHAQSSMAAIAPETPQRLALNQ